MSIFLITAPSGAGKTTLVKQLQKTGLWTECISHTTRKKRLDEVEGDTYYYVSVDEFLGMMNRKELAEMVMYNKNHYGVSIQEIERVSNGGKHVAVIVEYEGYKQMKALYPDAVGIFIHMSKEDCLANMLLRGDSVVNAVERIKLYDEEIKDKHDYDYVLKNVRNKSSELFNIVSQITYQYKG